MRSRRTKTVAGWLGLVVLASGIVGGSWLLENLRSKTEQRLADRLQRPVELAGVRRISQRGLHWGQVHLPPTDRDPSSVVIDGIILGIDGQAGRRGQWPQVTVTLVRPQVAVVQRQDGAWPTLSRQGWAEWTVQNRGETSSLAQRVSSLRVEDGRLTVSSQMPDVAHPPLVFEGLNGAVQAGEFGGNQPLAVDLSGQHGPGYVELSGGVHPADGRGHRRLSLTARGANLPMTGTNWLLPAPFTLKTGVLNGNLAVTLPLTVQNQPDMKHLEVQGMVIAQAGQGQLGQVAEPLNWRSTLWFQGQQVTLHDTKLQLGELSLSVDGTAGVATGYDLVAQVPTIDSAALEQLIGQPLPLAPGQTFEGALRLTGPWQDPALELWTTGDPPAGSLALPLDPNFIATAVGMAMQGLPLRRRISLIEGASYNFRGNGAWFTLRDGTVVPPLSESAYNRARARFATTLSPGLDRKFFWFLQTGPYVTAIAADLEKGKLEDFRRGQRFDTDRFFLDYFLPIYIESSRAAGLDPGEALWMLDHSLRTLHDPLLRTPQATPITSGAGTVGSFWQDEQDLSMKQMVLRPFFAQTGPLGQWLRFGVVKHLEQSTQLDSRRLASTPEVLSKLPNVTYGAEEGAIALALGIVQFPSQGIYSPEVRTLAERIVDNERQKQTLRTALTDQLRALATQHPRPLALALAEGIATGDLGLGETLTPSAAAHLNGGNILSVLVSRSEKAGYSLPAAYANARALLKEWLRGEGQTTPADSLVFALLRDYGLSPAFWDWLGQQLPPLAPQAEDALALVQDYHQAATAGAVLQEALYAAMVQSDEDISVSATIKQAIGFQAQLADILDQALAPADPYDPRYIAFRRSLAIYLREAPDISVYGGAPATLRAYAQETLNVQELLAVDVAAAPRAQALAAIYAEARAHRLIDEWDVPGFQRLMLTGAMLAAGVNRDDLPSALRSVGFPSAEFRHHLLFAVGVEGIAVEATRLGVQAHDYRVPFQPVPLPGYLAPSFHGPDALACPSQPTLAAIALGPQSQFIWHEPSQRVWLQRAEVSCYLSADWGGLTFPALLETVPIDHSPAGRDRLQHKLEEAQRLEAGLF